MTDYYFDATSGDDTNSGPYSAGNALQHLPGTGEATNNANFIPTTGDILYLKRGETWNTRRFLMQSWSGTPASPIIFDAYGTGERPIIDMLNHFIDTDWTNDGGTTNVWYAALPAGTDSLNRVFFNGTGQGSAATSAATVDADDPWWFDDTNDDLYVYSGSEVNDPTTVWGTVNCVSQAPSNYGKHVCFIYRSESININNLHFRGGFSHGIRVQNEQFGTSAGNVKISNCTCDYLGGMGISFSTTVAQDFEPDNYIGNCLIDHKWSSLENDSTEHNGDGIEIVGGVTDCIIEHNIVIDSPHTGIAVNPTGDRDSFNIIIRYNDISAPVTDYGRGLGTAGTGTHVHDIHIYGNYIHNIPTRNQFAGKNIYVHNNIFDTVRDSWDAGTSQCMTINSRSASDANNINIYNNYIANVEEEGIWVVPDNTYPMGDIKIYNNIVVNCGTEFRYQEYDAPPSSFQIYNNVFYNSSTTDVINWDGTIYTVAEAEAAQTEIQNTVTSEPLLNTQHKPKSSSPCIGTGTAVLSNRDFNGTQRKSLSNDIGAIWFDAHNDTTEEPTLLASGVTR